MFPAWYSVLAVVLMLALGVLVLGLRFAPAAGRRTEVRHRASRARPAQVLRADLTRR